MVRYKVEKMVPASVTLQNKNRYSVEGWLFGETRLTDLSVTVGKETFRTRHKELIRLDVAAEYRDSSRYPAFSGFAIPVILSPVATPQSYPVTLSAKFKDGSIFEDTIGEIHIQPYIDEAHFSIPPGNYSIVICMTTYNPQIADFAVQVDSIVNQDTTDWICIIADDHSNLDTIAKMKDIIARDSRFILQEHENNVGFYANFERCLALVPRSARYVALSDQDDIWYPNKLTKLRNKLEAEPAPCLLVYSDMRIVHRKFGLMHNSYWVNRKNYYSSDKLDLLTVANTVTGAASLFRRELLDLALPFPEGGGVIYHDQWLAIVAAANGSIAYVDEALYDYMQHSHNVIGHSDFQKTNGAVKLKKFATEFIPRLFRLLFPPNKLFFYGIQFAEYYYRFMHVEAQHILILAETGMLRTTNPRMQELIARPLSISGLRQIRRKARRNHETLNNIEVTLLRSYMINWIVDTLVIPNRLAVRKFIMLMQPKLKRKADRQRSGEYREDKPSLLGKLLRSLRPKRGSASQGNYAGDSKQINSAALPWEKAAAKDSPLLEALPDGINLIGYSRAEMGSGEACRLAASSLTAADIPFGIISFLGSGGSRMADLTWVHKEIAKPIYNTNLLYINAVEMPELVSVYGQSLLQGKYNIGVWNWELPDFPDEWLDRFRYVHEIWVPSTFIADALAMKSPVPIVKMPHSIEMKLINRRDRAYFKLPESSFLFLTLYDVRSISERKNPRGSIEAFKAAFSPDDRSVGLVIKINQFDLDANDMSDLLAWRANYPNIYLIGETISRNDMNALLDICDSFISLHRSEGFGLGLAEAMYLGKPVIGTNWSAVTDFINESNACPVNYKLVPVGQDYGPYKAYQTWAEPDITHASRYMVRLVSDNEFRERVASAGQTYIRTFHSPSVIGEMMRKRLNYIRGWQRELIKKQESTT